MLTEAIRLHLVQLGILEAANWTHEQVMVYMDECLMEHSITEPETFEPLVADLLAHVKSNLLIVNQVLSKDLQS